MRTHKQEPRTAMMETRTSGSESGGCRSRLLLAKVPYSTALRRCERLKPDFFPGLRSLILLRCSDFSRPCWCWWLVPTPLTKLHLPRCGGRRDCQTAHCERVTTGTPTTEFPSES